MAQTPLTFGAGSPASTSLSSSGSSTKGSGENTQGTSNKSGQSNTSTSNKSSVDIANMSPQSQEALNNLILQISGGQPIIGRDQAAQMLAQQGIMPPRMDYALKGWGEGGGNVSGGAMVPVNPQEAAAYEARINEIIRQGGMTPPGTPELQKQSENIQQEISTVRGAREGYTKEAAFTDAKGAQAQLLRQAMEQFLPGLNNAIEASGTSGSATGGLLKNDLATRSAESAAALGLKAAVDYGQIFDQQSTLIGGLIQNSSPALQALLNALGVAKGGVQLGNKTDDGTQSGSTNETANQNVTNAKIETGSTNEYKVGNPAFSNYTRI